MMFSLVSSRSLDTRLARDSLSTLSASIPPSTFAARPTSSSCDASPLSNESWTWMEPGEGREKSRVGDTPVAVCGRECNGGEPGLQQTGDV